MKVAIAVLAIVATAELALGEPGYGPSYGSPKPLPPPYGYNRPPNGAPAKYPPAAVPSAGYFNKNDAHSKYNPHGIGLQRGQPSQSPNFSRYPPAPPSAGKLQYQQQQQQQQSQQNHHHHHQTQQHHQQPAQRHGAPNFRPLGPQFQSKPHQFVANGAPSQGSAGPEQRIQTPQQRPNPKITNIWPGPKLSGPPDFPRFTAPAPVAAAPAVAPVTQASFPVPVRVPFPEKPRPSYIINSDDERGPIKTIPAPNLNPADKPANFEAQLYRAQHPSPYVQPLDNTITDDKQSYQVTENTKPYGGGQSSYYNAQEANAQSPHTAAADPTPVAAKLPLDVALQQHLESQQLQQQAAADALTPQELYSLLNGNAAAGAVQPATFMVQQPVMYAVPQPQLQLDPLQYQPQAVQLQYAQQPAAVQLQYVQPQQVVQYQPQQVQYEPQQQVQYRQPTEQHEQQQQQQQQQPQQQVQYRQPTEQHEQQQQQQQQQDEQQLENDVQYQRDQGADGGYDDDGGKAEREDRNKFDSFRNQYYSAVPNEQTAGVLAQIAESAAANSGVAVTAEPSRADAAVAQETAATALRAATSQPATEKAVAGGETSVQIQQSVQPLYEEGSSYPSSRRTNQEYVDDDDGDGRDDDMMEGSETAQQTKVVSKVSSSSTSVNGHAPSQFPYNAAKINAIAATD